MPCQIFFIVTVALSIMDNKFEQKHHQTNRNASIVLSDKKYLFSCQMKIYSPQKHDAYKRQCSCHV